jgi:hypothetical protein
MGYNPDEPRYCSVKPSAIKSVHQIGSVINVGGRLGYFIGACPRGVIVWYADGNTNYNLSTLFHSTDDIDIPRIRQASLSIGIHPEGMGYDCVAEGAFSWEEPAVPLAAVRENQTGRQPLFLTPGTRIMVNGKKATYVCRHSIHPYSKNSTDLIVHYDAEPVGGGRMSGASGISSVAKELRAAAVHLGFDPEAMTYGFIPVSSDISALLEPPVMPVDVAKQPELATDQWQIVIETDPEKGGKTEEQYDSAYLELEKGDVAKISVRNEHDFEWSDWQEREAIVIDDITTNDKEWVVLYLKEPYDDGTEWDEGEFEETYASSIAAAKEMGLELTPKNAWICQGDDTRVIEKLTKYEPPVKKEEGGLTPAMIFMGALAGAMFTAGAKGAKDSVRIATDTDVSVDVETEASTEIESEIVG